MKTTGVLALTLLVATIFTITPLMGTASTAKNAPTFYFTKDGKVIGPAAGISSPKANDIAIIFVTTPAAKVACSIQFSVAGKLVNPISPCPAKATDVEVSWTTSSAGQVITKCVWTLDGKAIAGACTVPKGATDFTFKAYKITYVYWSLNGKMLPNPYLGPKGANDVEFSFRAAPVS